MGKTQSIGCDCEKPKPGDPGNTCCCTNSLDIPRDANPPAQWICGSCRGGNHTWPY